MDIVKETKNKLLIKKYAKEYFYMEDKSFDLFTHRLMYERIIAPEYKELIKDSKDGRIYFDVPENLEEVMDKSWATFKDAFEGFDISYKEYKNNSVIVGKNKLKLYKAIKGFYFSSNDSWTVYSFIDRYFVVMFKYRREEIVNFLMKMCGEGIKKSIFLFLNKYFEISVSPCHDENEPYILFNLRSYTINFSKDTLEEIKKMEGITVLEDFQTINLTFKMQSKKILKEMDIEEFVRKVTIDKPAKTTFKAVLSINFADWFLCSTGNPWSSCLSLESEGDTLMGLPGLIGDKNRAIFYITDGKEKDFFGIKAPVMLYRSWVILLRQKNSSEKYFFFPRQYPNNGINLSEIFYSLTGKRVLKGDQEKDLRGAYLFEAFYHNFDHRDDSLTLMTIYNDGLDPCFAEKNKKAKYSPFKYLYYGEKRRFERKLLFVSKDFSSALKNRDHYYFYNSVENCLLENDKMKLCCED